MTFKFKISPKEKDSFILNSSQLVEILLTNLESSFDQEKEPVYLELIQNLNSHFLNIEKSKDLTIKQLFIVYFLFGYNYKLFLQNNNVEIIKD